MCIDIINKASFFNIREINVSEISFEPSLLELCKMNSCGNYGRNYTCPPLVGDINNLTKQVKQYDKALVFQKIYSLSDSFDIEGMENSRIDFRELTHQLNDICKDGFDNYLLLTAGGCSECRECAAVSGEPCRYPKKAYSSLEAYAINVSVLAEKCGFKYINGKNTVTYFGAVFYKN